MELLLNLFWLMIVTTGFMLVSKRSGHVWLILACIAVLLFPIVSASDDMNAGTFNDVAAAVVVSLVLLVAFVTVARLRAAQFTRYAVHVATPSDPRSPPAR
jgi:hypothetical protein